jgi:hypothetical protein
MLSLPTWVQKGLKAFLEILLLTYEVKPYKPKALQPSLNVKQIVEIG